MIEIKVQKEKDGGACAVDNKMSGSGCDLIDEMYAVLRMFDKLENGQLLLRALEQFLDYKGVK